MSVRDEGSALGPKRSVPENSTRRSLPTAGQKLRAAKIPARVGFKAEHEI